MSEETGRALSAMTAMALVAFLAFEVRGCSADSDTARNEREAKERQQMIEAGYERKQVPDRFTTEWVKKEDVR